MKRMIFSMAFLTSMLFFSPSRANMYVEGPSHHWEQLARLASIFGSVSGMMDGCKIDTIILRSAWTQLIIRSRIPKMQLDILDDIAYANAKRINVDETSEMCGTVRGQGTSTAALFHSIQISPPNGSLK